MTNTCQSYSDDEPLLVPIPTAQHQLGQVHRGTILKLVQQGKLERVHIGRRAMITTASIRALAVGRQSVTTMKP